MGPRSFSSSSRPLAGYCPPPLSVPEAERLCGGNWCRLSRRRGGTAQPCWVPRKEVGSFTVPACPLPAAQECPPRRLHPDPRWTRLVPEGPQRAPEMLTRLLYILGGSPGASHGFPEKEPSQMAHSSWAGGPFLSVNLLSRTVV